MYETSVDIMRHNQIKKTNTYERFGSLYLDNGDVSLICIKCMYLHRLRNYIQLAINSPQFTKTQKANHGVIIDDAHYIYNGVFSCLTKFLIKKKLHCELTTCDKLVLLISNKICSRVP